MDLEFEGVTKHPGYLQVADQIREAILRGRLGTGQELPTEKDLSGAFGVSRTTVREALRTLQAEGLITKGHSAPSRPVVNATPSVLADLFQKLLAFEQISMLDIIQFRCMLEFAAVGWAAMDARPEEWAEAEEALERMRLATCNVEDLVHAYIDFHVALVRRSGNAAMSLTMQATQTVLEADLLQGFRKLYADDASALEQLYRDHAELLATLRVKRDAETARDLIGDQIRGFYAQLLVMPSTADPPMPIEVLESELQRDST